MRRRFFAFFGICFSALLVLPVLSHGDTSGMSAQDILDKCARAYDALPNYQCHTEVTSHGMGATSYHTTSDIVFLRPGMIRVEGTDMFGHQYAYTCDGTNTYQLQLGSWTKAQSAEMAIAAVTGTAQSGATIIPALLLHTKWGYPFSPALLVDPTVATQSVNGHSCYFVTAKSPTKEASMKGAFWIDKKTFLLDQVATNVSFGAIHLHELQVITDAHMNPAINASAFAAPAGQ